MSGYEGRRVLVTGGAGFIGHHLVAALTRSGANVLVIDDLSAGSAERLAPDVEFERLDIASDDLKGVLDRWRPSTMFHLAAQVSVPRSEADPEYDLRVNGLGTLRLVTAARGSGARRLVFTSSGGAVYGETSTPATEQSSARPDSAYGIHKLLAEQYVARSGIPYAIARPSNIYGPGQDAMGEGAVVAVFTSAAREGRSIVIHGDGTQERDFLHVLDLVDGLMLLGAVGSDGIWNVSAGTSTSILELAELVGRIAGQPLDRATGPRRPADVHLSRVASARLRDLGWSPRVELAAGLAGLLASASPQ